MQRAVGDHIQSLPGRQAESERRLWSFVSDFTENKMDGDKLQKLFVKLKANKAAPSGRRVNVCVCVCVCVCVSACPCTSVCVFVFVSLPLSGYACVYLKALLCLLALIKPMDLLHCPVVTR